MLLGAVDWDWDVIIQTLPYLLKATITTIELAVISIFFGLIIGLIIALMKISSIKIFNIVGSLYTWIFRGIPLMVQLFLIYFGLSAALGIDLDSFTAAIIGISICGGAYIAEIIRSGIQAVDKGQMEAARSLGFHHGEAMKLVILPQAVKNILPALGNEFVTIIKESSIVSVIGIADLMYRAKGVIAKTYNSLECLAIAAIMYFILTFIGGRLIALMERKMAHGRK